MTISVSPVSEVHGRFGGIYVEGQAFLDVELHRGGVAREVPDRVVLANGQIEVAAALAQDDRSVDCRGPHDRAAEDLAEVLENGVTTMLGRLCHSGEAPRPH